jgi:hypothetical protein
MWLKTAATIEVNDKVWTPEQHIGNVQDVSGDKATVILDVSKTVETWQISKLKKAASDNQLMMGIEVEKEHAPTVSKIQASIKDGKITMSDEDIYKSIAEDHLAEIKNYYTLLNKMESDAKQSKEV